jgi:hypothetical protein
VQRSYWKTYWFLKSIDAVRIELNDVAKGHDWYNSFTHAACANQEHVAYSLFTDIVLSGDANPATEWRDYYKDYNIPTPTFDH